MSIADMEIQLFEFSRSNPDCDHCKSILDAITKWPQYVHDNCDCLCHRWKSKKGKLELEEIKKQSRKRRTKK